MTKAPNHTELLAKAKRLDRDEAAIKRQRLALARKLIEAGRALGGDQLVEAAPPKKKRRIYRRRAVKRAQVAKPAAPAPQPRKGGRSQSETGWTGTMLRILTEADRLMPYAELKAEIQKTPLAPKLAQSDKSFYGGILKLEQREQAVRYHGRVGTVQAYARYIADVAAGLMKEDPPILNTGGNRKSPAKDALFEILQRDARGAPPADVVNELTQKLNLETKNSKTAVYNLIARLLKRGEIAKVGKNIALPREVENLFQRSGAANAVH